jgi:asparagine synthase (glutamine-hydrolysing)
MARQVTDHRVKTFSVGFEAEGSDLDETDIAARTAGHIGTDHTRVIVRGEEVRDRITQIAYALDQPTVDGVNSYFVSLAARQAVTVAISGTGGDELFAGYPWIARMAFEEKSQGQEVWKTFARAALAPAVRLSLFDSFPSARIRHRIEQLRYTTDFRTRYVSAYHIFDGQRATSLLAKVLRGPAHAGRSAYHDLRNIDELPHGSAIERASGICLRGYTNAQLLRDIDAVSMSHSLEVRVPYLDPEVADAALSLPDRSKLGESPDAWTWEPRSYRETGTKRVLLDVARPFLPEGYDTEPKRGFGMPFEAWLRGPLREVLCDTLSSESISRRGLFEQREIEAAKTEFLEGSSHDWPRPWLLMMIELWAREILDRAPESFAGVREHKASHASVLEQALV